MAAIVSYYRLIALLAMIYRNAANSGDRAGCLWSTYEDRSDEARFDRSGLYTADWSTSCV